MAQKKKVESKLPLRELEICSRLRELRTSLKWDMPDFARELNITRDRLASYEYGRAPVRYWLARELGKRFDINQRWLATGKKPIKEYVDIDLTVEGNIEPRMLFSEVYDKMIGRLVEERLAAISHLLKVPVESLDEATWRGEWPDAGANATERLRYVLVKLIQARLVWLPPHLKESFFNSILKADFDFSTKYAKEIESYHRDKPSGGKKAKKP